MSAADIKQMGRSFLLLSTMSPSPEKLNAATMPIPNVVIISDNEDEQVVDLEAVAEEAWKKLERELVDGKCYRLLQCYPTRCLRNSAGLGWKRRVSGQWPQLVHCTYLLP